MEIEENKIDVELETRQKMILTDRGSRVFSTLNMLSIVMCVILIALFGYKFYTRNSMISESKLISFGVGNFSRTIFNQADIAQVTRRMELLSSGGVSGDSRDLATLTQLNFTNTLDKFKDLSLEMYMENFNFEGAYFSLKMDKSKLQTKTKKHYIIEGGM